jgi:CMP-N,N'-diacetyllegionaminic acid synthase
MRFDGRAVTAVALVPARAGSQRVPGKNVRELAGHPLLAYTVAAARESGVFTEVVVSTDSEEIAEVARAYGAAVPGLRPAEMSTATSPDVDWVVHVMRDRDEGAFAILRPTSPFRTAATIRRAWAQFEALGDRVDSLRAVELVKQHPGKMWLVEGDLMRPLLEQGAGEVPFHSTQYAALPAVYVQNSSLELAWRGVLDGSRPTIAGERVAPFLTEGLEGLSIDYPEDFERAEALAAQLPPVERALA